jgi:hypothetical protein
MQEGKANPSMASAAAQNAADPHSASEAGQPGKKKKKKGELEQASDSCL